MKLHLQSIRKLLIYNIQYEEYKFLKIIFSGYEKLEHGTSRSFVVTHPEDVGRIRRIEFYWEYDMDVLQPRSICFLWCNDHLYVASIRVTETKDITARE